MPRSKSPLAFFLPALLLCTGCTGVIGIDPRIAVQTLAVPASAERADPHANRLRVVTYNIRHGEDTNGQPSLDQIAATLRSTRADVVVLNEVDRFWRRSAYTDQPLEIARMAGMAYYAFGPSFAIPSDSHGNSEYGNALLSRYPIVRAERHPLPGAAWQEPRSVIVAELDVNGTRVTVLATHLGLDAQERARQVRALLDLVAQRTTPHLVLAGDFNALADSAEIAALREQLVDSHAILGAEAPTFPFPRPQSRIDYVFVTPELAPRILRHEALHVGGSDHIPVVVELELGFPAPPPVETVP